MKPTLNTDRLKKKRLEKGWNKLTTSQMMNIPQSAYVRYENGTRTPSYAALTHMALTLGTSVEYLTDQTDEDHPSDYIVSTKDERLNYIIDTYHNVPEDGMARLYKYAQKLRSLY